MNPLWYDIMAASKNPKIMGTKLYKKIWGAYDLDWGACSLLILGGQGSVKTAACLDIAEKKMNIHSKEKIFWYDTLGSPCQFRKLRHHPYEIFVENGLNIIFYNANKGETVKPCITHFKSVEELYDLAEYQTLNVVYFNNKKHWIAFNEKKKDNAGYEDVTQTCLMDYLMEKKQFEWQTIFFDEIESIFPNGANNQNPEKWWTWLNDTVPARIKEGRKCRIASIGNFHNWGSVYHEVRNKFMMHMWGFGSRPCNTRVHQNCVDQCRPGQFWIDHEGMLFGKIQIEKMYKPPEEQWIATVK